MHFLITGMFDSSNGVEHAVNAGNSQSGDRHDRKPPRTDRKDFTSGVVGVSINRQGSSDEPGMDEIDHLTQEEVSGIQSYTWDAYPVTGKFVRCPQKINGYSLWIKC